MPAQSNGAIPARLVLSGTCRTKCSSTTMLFEYPPKVIPPKWLSGELYVPVKPTSQYCSSPALQLAQVRHESTMQPTAARSPTLKRVTSLPTAVTRPTISCPGTTGYVVLVHSLRTVCRSEWQTPQ